MTARAAGCALVAAALVVACAIRAPRVSGTAAAPCSSTAQCEMDSVCFLGECRRSSSQLSVVLAQVRAPADQQLGVLQRAGIDVRVSPLVDFQLQPLLVASGTVLQALDAPAGATVPVADAGVVLNEAAPAITDRGGSVTAQTDADGGFSLSFPASTWNVLILPPPPGPPIRPPPPNSPLDATATGLQMVLPRPADRAQVTGTLLSGGAALGGAQVIAVDRNRQPLSISAISDPQTGAFTLLLPPGPPQFLLQVGPVPDGSPPPANPAPPIPMFAPLGPFAATSLGPLEMGTLPQPAVLNGKVQDARGLPVASAQVAALSLDLTTSVIFRQATSDSTGSFSLSLRAGRYVVEAAPDPDPSLPGLSGEIELTVAQGDAPVVLTCPGKSQAVGVVTKPDGQRVWSGYQVNATRLADRLIGGRVSRTSATDTSGAFVLVGDAGRYRLEVVPPASTGLPRKIVTVDLGVSAQPIALPTLQLSPPLAVVGTVTRTGGQPVAGATVDFFALDASGVRSVLIGSGLSDPNGNYRAVLPDVPSPANQVP